MSSYSHEEYKLALQKISKTAGKTFWLTDSVLEMFNRVGLKTPPLIAKGTLCDIIPIIHERMIANSSEGVVFTPFGTDYATGPATFEFNC
mgnify:CR=1 FL=1